MKKYRVVPRYGSKPGSKPTAFAVVDENGIEIKREIHREAAERQAHLLNGHPMKKRNLIDL